jgi:uncharacterized protein
MKYVMFYEADAAGRARTPEFFPAHRARLEEFHRAGRLLMVGAFTNVEEEGPSSMGIFPSREDAEDFISGDPFVQNGLIHRWQVREWLDIPEWAS